MTWKIKKKFKDGAIIYENKKLMVSVLIAKLIKGRWNVEPSTRLFPTKSFKTKIQALTYARKQMAKKK